MKDRTLLIALLMGAAGCATAQAAAAQPPSTDIGEVVVTADRQAKTLNRVPISVHAITQEGLSQQGILNMSDLARAVPSLTFRPLFAQPVSAQSGAFISIRGILATAGSPTTGVYLDDIALQKRITGQAGSGVILPKLFDLDRIEVLRGPQGTLYGGSSQGGAVRFITPTPSLTRRSGAARAEFSFTDGGDPSEELDLAVGGPIVQDKLGFRVSGQFSHVGGYIDHIEPSTGQKLFTNSNSDQSYALRLALLWRPTERLSIEPTLYLATDKKRDSDSFWSDVPAYTLPAATFGATGAPATGAAVRYTRPALNYPALFYGPGKTGETQLSPRREILSVYALNIDYDLGWATFKSVTGYERDSTTGHAVITPNLISLHTPYWGGYSQLTPFYQGLSSVHSTHETESQEFRLNSRTDQRLTWVAGVYYAQSVIHSSLFAPEDTLDAATRALRGVSATTFFGVDFDAVQHFSSAALQNWKDTSLAGYAEANFAITDKLKAIAGVRVSKEKFKFDSCTYGLGRGVLTCTIANANLISANTTSDPVSPKAGLTYQLDERNMVYATVARGFRAGGINTPVPNTPVCGTALSLIGKSPTSFDPDYVTSYETGAKLRLFGGRAAINSSLYRVDWTGLQLTVALPGCPFNYTANVGQARSQGFDADAQFKLVNGLTVNLSVAYTDAKYRETTSNRDPSGAVVSVAAFKGDPLPVAPWTLDLGFTYDFSIMSGRSAYIHFDYQYYSPFRRTTGPGSLSYAADIYNAAKSQIANARIGMKFGDAEVALFGKNIFDSKDILDATGGRVCGKLTDPTCANPASTVYLFRENTFRPREFGLSVNYRY